jgi:Ca-activated chloride channel family protein
MKEFVFAYPKVLFLLLLLIPIIVWYLFKYRRTIPSIQVSTIRPFLNMHASFKHILGHILFDIKLIAVALLIIILARPQSTNSWENVSTQGIDIVLALDISGSMLARDFNPDRIGASKDIATEFISGRPTDRIGLVIFSAESFTQCPLTTDHAVLINLLKDVKSGMIDDGTAIGVGLANAVQRLKNSDAISKVIILLTDGVNNTGVIDPITAAELAKAFGIRVYTVGIGTMGTAPYPAQDMFGNIVMQPMKVEIDEKTLQQISDITGGKYFRATDNQKLRQIYSDIDKMEKSKISVKEYSRKVEEYLPYAIGALIILVLEFLLRKLILRSIP